MRLPRKDGLNIVPFIDIMLVLLAIVLSVSTFIAQGLIKVDLPNSKTSSQMQEMLKTTIKVDKDSQIFIDDNSIKRDELETKLKSIEKENLILLHLDKDSKFDDFIFIIDILKEIKHENFSIVTKKEQ
ncbi:MAG: TonB system transport protein ExbD [Campylobacter sp.]|nr:TonB system transport protein ExbD [Campylobacter sp.]